MTISVVPVPRPEFRRRLRESVHLYVRAMAYDPVVVPARQAMWSVHMSQPNWFAVAAVDHAADISGKAALADGTSHLAGVAYCYSGRPHQWWHQQVHGGLQAHGWPRERIERLLNDYTELTEIHVHPDFQGKGLGRRMLQLLLSNRPDGNVLLSTPEVPGEANRAWHLYRSLGFTDVLRDFNFPGDERPFSILGARLPLEDSH